MTKNEFYELMIKWDKETGSRDKFWNEVLTPAREKVAEMKEKAHAIAEELIKANDWKLSKAQTEVVKEAVFYRYKNKLGAEYLLNHYELFNTREDLVDEYVTEYESKGYVLVTANSRTLAKLVDLGVFDLIDDGGSYPDVLKCNFDFELPEGEGEIAPENEVTYTDIREAFNSFKTECEKYANESLAQVVVNLKGYEWQKEVFNKLTDVFRLETEVAHTINELTDQEKDTKILAYYIMKRSLNFFVVYEEMDLKVVRGDFTEGNRVVVSVNGDQVERVVHYSREAGDLYITYKNRKYYYFEFN